MNARPLIVHVLYRLDTGGMERVLVTFINHTRSQYRHAVVCLDGFSEFRENIVDPNVPCLALDKKPGKDWGCYVRLWRTLRKLRPDLVATYNIGALDVAPVARLAGARVIVHAEHGRDVSDPHGRNRKYRLLRRYLAPFITRFVPVSHDLESWLRDSVGIAPAKLAVIPNGIETSLYRPLGEAHVRPLLATFAPPGSLLIGAVGRLDAVKDHAGLIGAFRMLCDNHHENASDLRLVIVGEGGQRRMLERRIARLGLEGQVFLLGNRADVASLMPELDVFVLSSVAEGIPLTVLEAMASGLPVVATDVGGVGEVVVPGVTGALVPPSNAPALAGALGRYVESGDLRAQHGRAGRERVQARFDASTMVSAYVALYDQLLQTHGMPEPSNGHVGRAQPRER